MSRLKNDKRTKYLNNVFCLNDPVLKDIQDTAKKSNVYHMQISPYEGKILYFLARMISAKNIVEIGTLFAYSTFHLAKALPEDGLIFTCDISEENQKKAKELLKDTKEFQKIRWICGEAKESLKTLDKKGPFDLVFIDANKIGYDYYLDWGIKNLKKGGLLIGDNSFLFGSVYGEPQKDKIDPKDLKVMKFFNEKIAHLDGICIPTDEGLSVVMKR